MRAPSHKLGLLRCDRDGLEEPGVPSLVFAWAYVLAIVAWMCHRHGAWISASFLWALAAVLGVSSARAVLRPPKNAPD